MSSIFSFSKNTFEGKLPEEKTILVTRKHWFVLFLPLLVILLLAILPFLIYFFIKGFSWYNIVSSLYWFSVTVYFLVLWIFSFYHIVLYILTTTVVTNKRLIKISQKGLFNYERNETELNKIQDISIKIAGITETFLNFGNLEVQTAGTEVKFCFYQLPNPQKIKEIISQNLIS